MRIAVYGKTTAEAHSSVVKNVVSQLLAKNVQVSVFSYLKDFITAEFDGDARISYFAVNSELQGYNYLISIGGDGTFLDAATVVRDSGLPMVGINTGRLGFLTEFSKVELADAIDALLSNNVSIEKRALLKIENTEYDFDGFPCALNELTVQKNGTSMLGVDVYLNEVFLNSYWADGLIISTATGSTAYSLSCEGPILTPDSPNFIINPIAAHNLSVRPLVLPDSGTLRLKVSSRSNDFAASLDSRSHTFSTTTELKVSKAPFEINLVRRPGQDFFNTLRHKLFWGSDKRS